jgi:uncharacterized phosphosugar-binding protein
MNEPAYARLARSRVDWIIDTQLTAVDAAASIVADTIAAGGILQAFGTGHSRIVTLELASRAGGLAPVGMLAVKDLVMFGGRDPKQILDPTYERESQLAQQIYDLASPDPIDTFLIVSNSGINAAIIEMAALARERGHPVLAITAVAHTRSEQARQIGHQHLADLADVVIDNGAPAGDAAIDLGDGIKIGAVSSLTGVLIAHLLTELICRKLLSMGRTPPVYASANLAGGDAHNARIEQTYRGRIRPIEP